MGNIRINVGAVFAANSEIQSANNMVKRVESELKIVKNRIDGQILNRNNIFNRLQSVSSKLSATDSLLTRIERTVANGADNYRKTDNAIALWQKGITPPAGAGVAVSLGLSFPTQIFDSNQFFKRKKIDKKEKKPSVWSMEDTFKVIAEGGIVGSLISTIGSFITGAKSLKDYASLNKGVAKIIEKTVKALTSESSPSFDWKALIGWNRVITDKTPKTFLGNIGESFEKLNFGSAKTVGEKVCVVTKWAGHVLTGVTTAYDNFTDTSENNTVERKIAETIGETTVKIGEGILIDAALTTACIALSANPPALVVGGVTVLVTWGIDALCEHLTDKDLPELVSDAVLDFGKSAWSFLKDLTGAVTTAPKKLSVSW